MSRWFPFLFSHLKVGRKLLLMSLLPLLVTLSLSGVMVRDRMRQLEGARRELAGLACLDDVYRVLRAASTQDGSAAARQTTAMLSVPTCARSGDGVERPLEQALASLSGDAAWQLPGVPGLARLATLRVEVLDQAEVLLGAVAWQSRLGSSSALDDGRYVLPVLLARLPEVMVLAQRQEALLLEAASPPKLESTPKPEGESTLGNWRSRVFGLDGQLTAQARLLELDLRRAQSVAGSGPLANALQPQAQTLAALDTLSRAARAVALDPATPTLQSLQQVLAARAQLLGLIDGNVVRLLSPLQGLVQQRIEARWRKLLLELGAGGLLGLLVLLGLYGMGRDITVPLKQLAEVARSLRRQGDYSRRVDWRRRDEFGQVARALNQVLDRLGRQRAAVDELSTMLNTLQAQQTLVDILPLPIAVTALPTHELLHANEAGRAWMGGRGDPWYGLEPEMRKQVLHRLVDNGQIDDLELRWLGGDKASWCVLSARRLVYEGRSAVLCVFTPVERFAQAEAGLSLWAQVFEAATEGLALFDQGRGVVSVNPALCRLGGCRAEDLVGTGLEQLLADDVPAEFIERLWREVESKGRWQGELRLRHGQGGMLPVRAVASVIRDAAAASAAAASSASASAASGAPAEAAGRYIVLSLVDLSEHKAQEQRINHLAYHDVLTGLPNRELFLQRLQGLLRRARDAEPSVVVLSIELERLGEIKQSRGRAACDTVLRAVAQRLQESVRGDDVVCRLGEDGFAVALWAVADTDAALRLVRERFLPVLRRPHEVLGVVLRVGCSVGMAACDIDVDGEEALRRADAAMLQARSQGSDDVCMFTAEIQERAHRLRLLEAQLRRAVSARELSLHWQPRVSARDGALTSIEALLRWNSARLGAVAPAEFVPVAEATRLIVPIGAWVIDQACRQLAQWQVQGVRPPLVSINLSPLQLREPGLREALESSLRRHGVAPALLELELTESAVMEDGDAMLEPLHELKSLGVGLSIDDFGTGRSNVNLLQRLPIDRLKIDRTLVAELARDPTQLAVARAIVGLGHTLGLQVVAEGVEDEATAAALRDMDCDELQGYHIVRPVSAAEVTAWLGPGTKPGGKGEKPRLAWVRDGDAA